MLFVLPNLKYSYSALEPHIDALTMEIHHSKHHQSYINNLNAALEKHPELQFRSVEEVINGLEKLPEDIKQAVRNNAGGHFNHTFFWNLMDPNPKKLPEGELLEKINQTFGSVDQLKEKFNAIALARFGSGWAWLVKTSTGDLEIYSTPNQDNPLMENKIPLIGLDVWEHAYYLKYQNRRVDYISNWWNLLNWQIVEEKYNA